MNSKKPSNQYPHICFWNTEAPKILWINQGFNIQRHLSLRGLEGHPLSESFGTSNKDEAIKRQKLMKQLVENDKLRDFILGKPFSKISDIPMHGQDFVNYFNPDQRNVFWQKAGELLQHVRSADISYCEELEEFAFNVNELMQQQERPEKIMADNAVSELVKATKIDGTLVARLCMKGMWSFEIVEEQATGFRMHNLNTPYEKASIDPCWDKPFFRKIGIYQFLMNRARRRKEEEIRKWAKPVIVSECPESVVNDVSAYLKNKLIDWKESGFPVPESKNDIVDFLVRFSYQGEGLRIKIVGLSPNQQVPEYYEQDWQTPLPVEMFRYYDEDQTKRAQTMSRSQIASSYSTMLMNTYYPKLRAWFCKNAKEVFGEQGMKIGSQASDALFKWKQVRMLCMTEEWRNIFRNAQSIRLYVEEHMRTLGMVAEIARAFVTRSKEFNLPITFPQILDGETASFKFKELWPVGLIGRKTSGSGAEEITAKMLRPVTALGDISGGISMLTGGNGAGKTTIGEELLGVLLDAASGFPIFGSGVALNLKTVVGSIYLERGDGSTMQLSLKKMVAVLREVGKHPMNGTLVFWDEAGTGTSADQGKILGMAALAKLREIGCTVLVNTQIAELAEHARTELGANCFQINMGHEIRTGIGKPSIHELAKSMGIDKILNLKE
jgi:hypothetical protein